MKDWGCGSLLSVCGYFKVIGRNLLGPKGRTGSKIRMKVTCKIQTKQNK